jgi:hypothetical protein
MYQRQRSHALLDLSDFRGIPCAFHGIGLKPGTRRFEVQFQLRRIFKNVLDGLSSWQCCGRGQCLGEKKKLEARKMLENGNESPPSSARCVSLHLIFLDMVQK